MKKTPTKHELLNLLADISHLWPEIGFSLNVSDNVLDGLKSSQDRDTVKLAKIIDTWLITNTSQPHFITWETVIEAIKGPIVKHIEKANAIHQYLTKGKLI